MKEEKRREEESFRCQSKFKNFKSSIKEQIKGRTLITVYNEEESEKYIRGKEKKIESKKRNKKKKKMKEDKKE